MFLVATEPADQAEIQRLLALSDSVAARLYPGAFRQPLKADTLARPGVALFVARDQTARALGCAALLDLFDGTAELKRMIVDPDYAGRASVAASSWRSSKRRESGAAPPCCSKSAF